VGEANQRAVTTKFFSSLTKSVAHKLRARAATVAGLRGRAQPAPVFRRSGIDLSTYLLQLFCT